MNYKLPTCEQKHDYVLNQFDRIAKKYDLANDLISLGMHRFWKKKAIDLLINHADSGVYLDLCCGTGDLALNIASRKNFTGSVIGFDFSSQMLAVAKRRLEKHKTKQRIISQVDFKQGDAQNLPFADNTFDGIIISFGLRNLTDLHKGLEEMTRVIKPGGKVVNLDLGKPSMPIFTPLFHFFFNNIVPIVGEIIQQDKEAYTYLPESGKTYPCPATLTGMFESVGLKQVEYIPLACASVALHLGTK